MLRLSSPALLRKCPEYIAGLEANIVRAKAKIDSFDPMYQQPLDIDKKTLVAFRLISASLHRQSAERNKAVGAEGPGKYIFREVDATAEELSPFGISPEVFRHIARFNAVQIAREAIEENKAEIEQVQTAVARIDVDAAEHACQDGIEITADDEGVTVATCQSPELTESERELTQELFEIQL